MSVPQVEIQVEPEVAVLVRQLASERHATPASIVRQAVEQLAQRDRLRHDVEHAWAHYTQTGLHLTADEADDWLARLEAGEDVPPPQCHV